MSYILIIWSIYKRFWLPITITAIGVAALTYTYHKGKESCESRISSAIIEEQLKHQREIEEILNKQSDLHIKVTNNPSDNESSCVLSGNPIKEKCFK